MSSILGTTEPRFAPVILAGGSGTRFWPRSRRSRAKQVLALDGERTMIQQTLDRLLPLAAPEDVWVITNALLESTIAGQLPDRARRPTSSASPPPATPPPPARSRPFCSPAPHLTPSSASFPPITSSATRPVSPRSSAPASPRRRRRTHRRPRRPPHPPRDRLRLHRARRNLPRERVQPAVNTRSAAYAASPRSPTCPPPSSSSPPATTSGTAASSSGPHAPWSTPSASTPPTWLMLLEAIAAAHGTPAFEQVFAELYPQCENISIDYAVLEPRSAKGEAASEIFCLPADFVWNDLGSWASLHEHLDRRPDRTTSSTRPCPANCLDRRRTQLRLRSRQGRRARRRLTISSSSKPAIASSSPAATAPRTSARSSSDLKRTGNESLT